MKRGGPLPRRTPMRPRRRGKRRESAWRSPKYLAWVRTRPCVVCGAPADDAHHLIGVGGVGGMGTKAGDGLAVPVCRRHHNEIHAEPALWPMQWEWVERTQRAAREAGWELPELRREG